jgi:hypothetical protein
LELVEMNDRVVRFDWEALVRPPFDVWHPAGNGFEVRVLDTDAPGTLRVRQVGKVDVVHPAGVHEYWSTHCRHGNHEACRATELAPGVPREYDHVVGDVNGTTITTHLPVAAVLSGIASPPAYSNPEDYEPDPDDMTRDQLAESDPMLYAVAESLDDWLVMHHGILSSHHNAGHFWTLLYEHGYRIVPNEPMSFPLLPPPTD